MRHLKTTLAVLGAVTILVLASNTVAIAATGKGFILGKINSANKQTTLTRTTNGPVLKLNAKSATGTPLAVRGSGKVANLNADKIDGKDSSAFAPSSVAANTPVAVGFINADGTVQTARGVASASWNEIGDRYEINLTGIEYAYNKFATLVTTACNDTTVRTAGGPGVLRIYLRAAGAPSQCDFAFSVIRLP